MTDTRRKTTNVVTNVMYNTIYEVLAIIAPFVSAPYASRVLGVESLGVQSYTLSIVSYFVIIAALGVSAYGAREIARCRDNAEECSRTFWEIALIIVGTSAVCLAAWAVFVGCFATEHKLIYTILTLNIASVALDVSWFYRGLEEFRLIVARNSIMKVLSVVAIFVFVKSPDDLDIYVFIFSASLLVGAISLLPALRSRLVRIDFGSLNMRRHVGELFVYFLPTVATSVYLILDKTLIGIFCDGDAENGYYAQADKIIAIAKTLVFASLNQVMGVRIAYLFKQNATGEIQQRIGNSINFIFCLGFALMWGIMGVSQTFVPIFFGEGYEPVAPLLMTFAPVLVIVGVSNCLGSHYYTPSGRRMQSTRYIVVGSAANVVLNLWLIPRYGAMGAALATIAAETIIATLYIINCGNYMTLRQLISSGFKKCVAGMIMFAAVYWLGQVLEIDTRVVLAVQGIVGAGIYAALLLAMHDSWAHEMMKTYILPRLKKTTK